ncbi:LacI family DNA-binding transcriptional regulator [Nonomuraea sp. NPDC052265]|uniref:LacI family DNA-binding transcriptional regulator n=1 Tax=Nonomuraea sp. NPDC052265 TaxID=3364374 RepID=UPI0037C5BEED
MKRRPGLSAVAERAGVSVSLVSRILTGDANLRVREETRQRVLRAAAELKYVPQVSGRALRLARSGAIGLVVQDVSNPIHAEIIRGAQLATAAHGQVLLLADSTELSSRPEAFDRLIGEGRVDGLLWQSSGFASEEELSSRAAKLLPTILVNNRPRAGVQGIRLADEEAAALAVRHLIELGHRDIGFVGGSGATDISIRRFEGFTRTMRAHDLPVRPEWTVFKEWDAAAGHAAMSELLAVPKRPTAVFVANVVVCVGALAAARENGLAVPGDLSLVALHDTWFVEHGAPPLTTVRLPLRDLGRQAAELIIAGDLGGPDDGFLLTEPPPELVVRASTGRP